MNILHRTEDWVRTRRSRVATSGRTSRESTAGTCTTADASPAFPRTRTADSRRSPGAQRPGRSRGFPRRDRALRSGDVQWLTAGEGIVHSEMFPLLDGRRAEPARAVPDLAQPAGAATSSACTTICGPRPRLRVVTDGGPELTVTLIAGQLDGADAPLAPPPASWASRPEADLAIWHLRLEPGPRGSSLPLGAGHGPHVATSSTATESTLPDTMNRSRAVPDRSLSRAGS